VVAVIQALVLRAQELADLARVRLAAALVHLDQAVALWVPAAAPVVLALPVAVLVQLALALQDQDQVQWVHLEPILEQVLEEQAQPDLAWEQAVVPALALPVAVRELPGVVQWVPALQVPAQWVLVLALVAVATQELPALRARVLAQWVQELVQVLVLPVRVPALQAVAAVLARLAQERVLRVQELADLVLARPARVVALAISANRYLK